MNETIDINNVLPDKIEKIIEFLKIILGNKISNKSTISKLVHRENSNHHCPFCESNNIVKNGQSKNGKQRYKCKNCLNRFCDTTNTMSNNTKLTY